MQMRGVERDIMDAIAIVGTLGLSVVLGLGCAQALLSTVFRLMSVPGRTAHTHMETD
jgi:hypothetical protein